MMAGIAVPVPTDMSDSIRLNEAARIVERELQNAPLKGGQYQANSVTINGIGKVQLP